jgi:tetrahydromethanopterin S-methyltransferase subunit F
MRSTGLDSRKKYVGVMISVAEGVWNGVVVSGVLVVSALLIDEFWIF